MTKFKLGLAIAAIAAAGVACGPSNNDNNNNTTPTNNTTAENNDNNTNNVTTNNDNNTNNATTTNNDNNTNNMTTPPVVDELPKCGDPDEPPRCSEDPTTVEWAPSSIINDFFIEGTDSEPVCCFDYTDDGDIDNSLGLNLAGFGLLADINTTVAESIGDGSLALTLEHEGLDALDNDDAFTVNFFLAEHDGDYGGACEDDTGCTDGVCTGATGDGSMDGECTFGDFDLAGANPVLIDPVSFDEGAQSQAYLPSAAIASSAVTAGPGSMKLEIELFESPLQLTISLARIEADVDPAASAMDDTGVALTSGKLGGVVRTEDIFVAVNEFAESSCACLGLGGEQLVNPADGQCADTPASTCEADNEDTCVEVAGACDLFGAVGIFADVDLDGDGLADSISVGAAFTAVGANITGLSQ